MLRIRSTISSRAELDGAHTSTWALGPACSEMRRAEHRTARPKVSSSVRPSSASGGMMSRRLRAESQGAPRAQSRALSTYGLDFGEDFGEEFGEEFTCKLCFVFVVYIDDEWTANCISKENRDRVPIFLLCIYRKVLGRCVGTFAVEKTIPFLRNKFGFLTSVSACPPPPPAPVAALSTVPQGALCIMMERRPRIVLVLPVPGGPWGGCGRDTVNRFS